MNNDFKDIPGHKGYKINTYGLVLSPRTKQVMKNCPNRYGYYRVGLSSQGKQKTYSVARLVLSAWQRLPEPGEEAAHLDGNKANNHISNLKWVTRHENEYHKKIHGTIARGSRQGSSKLTEAAVLDIRRRYIRAPNRKTNAKDLASEYGVTPNLINIIVRRKAWAHL